MLVLMPALGMSMPVHADDKSPYGLWVGGIAVTEANAGDVMSDGTVSFTPAESGGRATLTLNGANITKGYRPPGSSYLRGIYYDGTDALDIVL